MIRGIGIDLLEISRIEKPMKNPYFLNRVFTNPEIEYLTDKKAESAAGIFCAKEAIAKALGVGIFAIELQSIEILHEINGKPYVILHPPLEIMGTISLSITHTKTTAAAFVIWEE